MTTTSTTAPQSPVTLPKPRRRWVRVVLMFILFLSGMLAGGALVVGIVINRAQYWLHHPDEAPARLTTILRRRLDLSPSQADKVEQILRARQKNLQAIRREVEPKVSAELLELRQEIGNVLDNTQRAKWEHQFDEMMHRWWVPTPATTQSAD